MENKTVLKYIGASVLLILVGAIIMNMSPPIQNEKTKKSNYCACGK